VTTSLSINAHTFTRDKMKDRLRNSWRKWDRVRKAGQPLICKCGSDCVNELHPSHGECFPFKTQSANRQHSGKQDTTLFFGFVNGTSTTGKCSLSLSLSLSLTNTHTHTRTHTQYTQGHPAVRSEAQCRFPQQGGLFSLL